MERLRGAPGAMLLTILCGVAMPAPAAGEADPAVTPARSSPWAVTFSAEPVAGDADVRHAIRLTCSTARHLTDPSARGSRQDPAGPSASNDNQGTARTTAFVYSDGYRVRRKIHFIASFATIPLFATQYVLGKQLYDGTGSNGTRTAHRAVAIGVGALFGVNTVTGVWNLVEGRKDPNGRRKRLVHGILMLAADAGFVATAALAPRRDGSGDRTAHRTVALTSVALATAGYLIMLFGR
jgi:hypothetical protein